MPLIFQYGSNMSGKRLNGPERLNGAATDLGLVVTRDPFEYAFDVWSSTNRCAAADIVVARNGRQIWGVLYDIPDQCMPSLDRIEGVGANYCRHEIAVTTSNGVDIPGPVFTYTVRQPKAGLKTNLDYVNYILSGLTDHFAPPEYVQYVRSRIIENNPTLHDCLPATP